DAELLREFGVELGQLRLLDLLYPQGERGLLSRDFLAVIVGGERELEGLRFARRHAARCGVEFGKHATVVDAEDEVLRASALERLAGDLALEIDVDAIALLRRALDNNEARALLAQDIDRLVDRRIVDAHLRALDLRAREIADLHFRIHLEGRAEFERGRVCAVLLFDAREAGDLEVRFLPGIVMLRESCFSFVSTWRSISAAGSVTDTRRSSPSSVSTFAIPYQESLLRREGLEPTCLAAPAPKAGASTNSATLAAEKAEKNNVLYLRCPFGFLS